MNSSFEQDPKERFSGRVENYIKYRPDYPLAVVEYLREKFNLNSNHIIADIGSGTGILSKLFLDNGNKVLGVEPNRSMRGAAENILKDYPSFISVDGSAENTGLESSTINFVTAGQAFHWFNLQKAKNEFLRILKPNGIVILIWNSRKTNSGGFLNAYEDLLISCADDYSKVNHKNIDDEILKEFFSDYGVRRFNNYQKFNFDGLKGRLLSSSYAPLPGNSKYEFMMKELQNIFEKYNSDNQVTIGYDTEVYYGHI